MNEYNYNDWRNYLMHYNHNHDALGRFTTSSGGSVITPTIKIKDKVTKLEDLKIHKQVNIPFTKGAKPAKFSFHYSGDSKYRKPTPDMVKAAKYIMKNSDQLDKQLKAQALDNLYEPYIKYGFGTKSKSEFAKDLRCDEIVVGHNYSEDATPDSFFWYTHPEYGDWMIEYSTKNKKIFYQEFYR